MFSKCIFGVILLAIFFSGMVVAEKNQEIKGDLGDERLRRIGSQLILVKEFSVATIDTEGTDKEATGNATAKMTHRYKRVLAQRIPVHLVRSGFDAETYSDELNVGISLVVDGEFLKIQKNKPRVRVRFWVYRSDNPEVRIIQHDVAGVALKNLTRNLTAKLIIELPKIVDNSEGKPEQ